MSFLHWFFKRREEQPMTTRRPDPPKPIRSRFGPYVNVSVVDHELRQVNEKRREQGKRELTHSEAYAALQARQVSTSTSGPHRDTSMDFLIGLTTGIPMPSGEGIVGAMIHNSMESSNSHVDTTPSYAVPDTTPSSPVPDTTPSYSPPDPSPSPSFDSSSGSFDSGSSSY